MGLILHGDFIEKNGKTIRENNAAIGHNIPLGALVYVRYDEWGGDGVGVSMRVEARMRVVEHARDCDGTPLYGLAFCSLEAYRYWRSTLPAMLVNGPTGYRHGYAESSLTIVEETPAVLRGDDALAWPDDPPHAE